MNPSFSCRALSLLAATTVGALALLPSRATFGAPPPRAEPAPIVDEGMWTFDNPPLQILKQKYGFTPDAAWFEHVRLSSVRFNSGGSGSFVSADGLVMTNHHVGLDTIQKVSTSANDLVKTGVHAKTRAEELKAPDLELNVLQSTEDVTARVQAAVKEGASPKDANDQRKSAIAAIEKEESEKTGLRCDVVSLYRGGEYHVYRYKKLTDVRLVFCPEQQVAFFGGDPDNFTYPRYDLDISFFHVYENGQPYHPPHYLQWNPVGPKEDDLVFVPGNPGSTGRLQTAAQLQFQRAVAYPRGLVYLKSLRDALRDYSARGPEQARRAKEGIFGLENSIKAVTGYLGGLENPRTLIHKTDEEKELLGKLQDDKAAQGEYVKALGDIDAAYKRLLGYTDRLFWSRMQGDLASRALDLVRLAAELPKPNGERLREYRDSALASLKRSLFSDAPVYADLEEQELATRFKLALQKIGPNDPWVKAALGGRTPEEAAKAAVAGTKIADPKERERIFDAGAAEIASSTDSMIVLARTVDPIMRELRKRYEEEVESVESQSGEKLARARFKAYGRTQPPDATFTLRLSYGVVKGYEEGTSWVPWKTTYYGLYERNACFDNKPPFDLPARYFERKAAVDMKTPIDFVCTCDIIGGNSGSPVIDRDGRLIGIIFDGNIESLPNNFVYDDEKSRAVAVHSAGILMALRQLYDAGAIADEILTTR